jgi:hypothetical protein
MIKAYVKTLDGFSWFLVTSGAVVIATHAKSIALHNEHHGDVAGGLSLFAFLLCVTPFPLAVAGFGALLQKSMTPLFGAGLGVVASIPMLPLIEIFCGLLCYVSPLFVGPFPFFAGFALILAGILRNQSTRK